MTPTRGRASSSGVSILFAAFAICGGLAARPIDSTLAGFSSSTGTSTNSFTAAASFYRAQVMSDGPVAYWRLGETSGTAAIDETATVNGTYAGGYTRGVAGALAADTDRAVDLNGISGRISVPNVAALNLTSQVSIEAWVNPDSVTGTRWIVNKNTFYYLYIDNNTTYFGIRTPTAAYLFISKTGLVTLGGWQHLVGTYDGTKMVLYRNGVIAVEASVTGAIGTTTTGVTIGAVDGTGSFFDGSIDEVAIYNRSLTAAQAQAHYQRGT